MKRANSVEPAKFLPEVGKTDLQGVTAKIQFDDKGDVKDGAITLYQAKGGKWDALETVGGSPLAEAKQAAGEAMKAVGEAAQAAGEAAKDVAKEGVKAAAEAVKEAADAAKAAVDKK
jgi:branched-chain amino acid transport system substrate-binding protein